MLLPLLIPILCALLFLIFYRRPVDTSGIHAAYTVPIEPAKPQQPSQSSAPVVASPPPVEVPMNFNDVFAKPAKPSNRPNA